VGCWFWVNSSVCGSGPVVRGAAVFDLRGL
jgi:hypothetical protein